MNSKIIYISDKKAQVSKAFEQKARIFGTEEYMLWMAYRQDFPEAKMSVRKIKTKKDKQSYQGLSYKNMEKIIKECKPELLGKFAALKKSPFEKSPYHAVRAWFVDAIPDYKQFIPAQNEGESAEESKLKMAG